LERCNPRRIVDADEVELVDIELVGHRDHVGRPVVDAEPLDTALRQAVLAVVPAHEHRVGRNALEHRRDPWDLHLETGVAERQRRVHEHRPALAERPERDAHSIGRLRVANLRLDAHQQSPRTS
jgi:hypothetical protein